MSPRISIIIATYNRSEVLAHAIRSVLASSRDDWELIVVGDACTDDTAACVASFADERIRFVNLPQNSGDQAAPNNHGVSLARGEYIAFLNHDDFHLPEHLEVCASALDASDADLVWTAAVIAHRENDDSLSFHLEGIPPGHDYSPFAFYSASTWMFRRPLASRVGAWTPPSASWVTPSQHWLFRAWRSGARLRFIPRATAIILWSGTRAGSYARRNSPDHDEVARLLRDDPTFRERIYEQSAINAAQSAIRGRHYAPGPALLRIVAGPFYRLLSAAGIHPWSAGMALRHGGRGGLIRYHRHFTKIR